MMLRSAKITVVSTGSDVVEVDDVAAAGVGVGATAGFHPGMSPALAGSERTSVTAAVIASLFMRNLFV